MPDAELARYLYRSICAVSGARHRQGIPTFPSENHPARGWKPREDRLLGRFSDAEVGRRLGCPDHVVRRRRHRLGIPASRPLPKQKLWTLAEDKLLGTMPDGQLAVKLGRTLLAIKQRRVMHHLSPFQPEAVPVK